MTSYQKYFAVLLLLTAIGRSINAMRAEDVETTILSLIKDNQFAQAYQFVAEQSQLSDDQRAFYQSMVEQAEDIPSHTTPRPPSPIAAPVPVATIPLREQIAHLLDENRFGAANALVLAQPISQAEKDDFLAEINELQTICERTSPITGASSSDTSSTAESSGAMQEAMLLRKTVDQLIDQAEFDKARRLVRESSLLEREQMDFFQAIDDAQAMFMSTTSEETPVGPSTPKTTSPIVDFRAIVEEQLDLAKEVIMRNDFDSIAQFVGKLNEIKRKFGDDEKQILLLQDIEYALAQIHDQTVAQLTKLLEGIIAQSKTETISPAMLDELLAAVIKLHDQRILQDAPYTELKTALEELHEQMVKQSAQTEIVSALNSLKEQSKTEAIKLQVFVDLQEQIVQQKTVGILAEEQAAELMGQLEELRSLVTRNNTTTHRTKIEDMLKKAQKITDRETKKQLLNDIIDIMPESDELTYRAIRELRVLRF